MVCSSWRTPRDTVGWQLQVFSSCSHGSSRNGGHYRELTTWVHLFPWSLESRMQKWVTLGSDLRWKRWADQPSQLRFSLQLQFIFHVASAEQFCPKRCSFRERAWSTFHSSFLEVLALPKAPLNMTFCSLIPDGRWWWVFCAWKHQGWFCWCSKMGKVDRQPPFFKLTTGNKKVMRPNVHWDRASWWESWDWIT